MGVPGWISHYVAHEKYFNKNNRLADERKLNEILGNRKSAQNSNEIKKLVVERLLLNISGDRLLNESLILIGGAAMYYGHNFSKETFDLDFTWKEQPTIDDKLRVISRLKDMAKENDGIFGNELKPRQMSPKRGDDELTFDKYVFSYLLGENTTIEQYVQNGSKFKINFTIKQANIVGNNQEDNSVIKVECDNAESIFEPLKLVTDFGHILYQNLEDLFYGKLLALTSRGKDSDKIHLNQLVKKRGANIDLEILKQKITRIPKAKDTVISDVLQKAKEVIGNLV